MSKLRVRKPKNENVAYLFLLPWLIGLIFFIIYPFINTIWLSFNLVSKDVYGWTYSFIGTENYVTAFFRNTEFNQLVVGFISMEITYVPMILVISLILAILLNSKIKFRTGFRLIFFFPVVVISGPVMTQLRSSNTMQLMDISELLIFRMIDNISPFFSNILMSIFDNFTLILWFTGIPIILFLNGLQKIDNSLYEAAQIDGANSWQMLWKIMLPNLRSTGLVVGIYTVVQIAIFEVNPIYSFVVGTINSNYTNGLGFAAAVVIVYSAIVLAFVGVIFLVLRTKDDTKYLDTLKEKQLKHIARINRVQLKKLRDEETLKEWFDRVFKKKKDKGDMS
ncbi:carbohydrate ABC transporter permease [Acholeplasma laidlawii]|jgi:ABC-type sugar transport system permease subunit|uniref:ABC-type transport system, permease component n=2 Tax=Acholeplasma laidlawii TaxID=2148 RepID=A9NG55_ACHLI|nr:sugar ABC transporter permease [Acholeplasma laidlawii]ABX81335.1 ABC-type transport system, permease component [Acholeplasma laidlawii PG-8A]NWH10085.1 sugar ABC transporter permease [Acholeplasma laidlawii]NWH11475.1 sugar ABC transporter permease [Acholeplasma laidlawii]NWH13115.1 sugar ABC transporter permease [Acholeplasma laidlawii]NWH14617.1 sugar ABC transporter permease [Acholeplasma laidlawii]